MEDLDFQLEGICYQWTNMPLCESLKRIQQSADWIRELCPHKPVLLTQMAQTQRVQGCASASCLHNSAASDAVSSAFPALNIYEDDEEEDSFWDKFYEVATESHARLKQTAMVTYICHVCFSVPLTHPVPCFCSLESLINKRTLQAFHSGFPGEQS